MLSAGSRPGSPATEPQQVCGGTKQVRGLRMVPDRSTGKVA